MSSIAVARPMDTQQIICGQDNTFEVITMLIVCTIDFKVLIVINMFMLWPFFD
jgi:hypothetical protein